MNRAILYRIYPTTEQKQLITKTFGCCRKVWNLMLSDKQDCYKKTKTFGKQTPAEYKSEYPFLKEVDSLALANVQLNLQAAIRNCFSKSRKSKCGFPKFKSRHHARCSYTTNNQHGTVAITQNGIRLPKLGIVPAVIHRAPKEDWIVKSATVSQEPSGEYYVSVLFEYDAVITASTGTRIIGLDYKSDGLYADSESNICDMPHFYRDAQVKLAERQRKLKHMVVGSNNYKKQQRRIVKISQHTKNQRKDFLHKVSTEIANQYDIVCVEDLDMKAMSNRGFGNGKATLDNGYGMLRFMLAYKLKERGKQLVIIDKWFPSSQICHRCGKKHPDMRNLSKRIMDCNCGNHINRDVNAALNIRDEGLRMIAV